MERELLDRYCTDRSPQAAARLVEACQALITSVCRRYLRRPQDVEDAVQETIIKLLHHAESIHGDVRGWLTSAAYSTCIDLIRRTTAYRRRCIQLQYSAEPAREQMLVHETIQARLYDALLQLDEHPRELLIERFVRKTPLRVIAGRRDSSVATISRRTAAAVADLAAVLRDMGVASADDLTVAEHFGDPENQPPLAAGFAPQCDGEDGLRFAPDWQRLLTESPLFPPFVGADAAAAAAGQRFFPGWKRPLRVGAFVSHRSVIARDIKGKSHPHHADGWAVREAWLQVGTLARMLHPGCDFVGIVEPGTSAKGPIESVLRDYSIDAGLVDATDVEGLSTLDVILLGNNWVMTPAIAKAFHAAVRGGVGLLNDCCWTDLFGWCDGNVHVRALTLAESPTYRFHTPIHETPMGATVHEAHAVLPGLQAGAQATMPSCGPVYQVMKGAKLLMSRDHVVMPEEHKLPGVGPLRPPLYIVGQLGRGRVAVVNVHAHRWIQMIRGLRADYMDNLLAWLGEPKRESSSAAA